MDSFTRKEISDGVFLNSMQTDKFKTSCMSISFIVPLGYAKGAKTAIIPSILKMGTSKYPDMKALNDRINDLYGARIEPAVRKRGEILSVGFVCDVIDDQFAKDQNLVREAAELLCSLMFDPYVVSGCFDERYVKSEKQNLYDMIGAQINDKKQYAVRRLQELMCADEAFGRNELGTREEIQDITSSNVYEHYKELLELCRVEIFYFGSQDSSDVEKSFAGYVKPRQNSKLLKAQTDVKLQADEVRLYEDEMAVAQSKLALGFRTAITVKDQDFTALCMMNTIFGGSTNSKLFLNVREKMSLCYYASSNIEKFKGLMIVSSGVETDKINIAKDEILNQFHAIQNGDFTDDEIESAHKTLKNAFKSIKDSPISLESYYSGLICSDIDHDINKSIELLEKVTRDDVMRIANGVSLDTVYTLKGGNG